MTKRPYRRVACEVCGVEVVSNREHPICGPCGHRQFLDRLNLRRKHGKGWAVKRWEANGGRCWWCGEPLALADMHADHVIPISKGGGGGANLVPSCPQCNWRKNDRDAPAVALGFVELSE